MSRAVFGEPSLRDFVAERGGVLNIATQEFLEG